jgi:hypothetical protein
MTKPTIQYQTGDFHDFETAPASTDEVLARTMRAGLYSLNRVQNPGRRNQHPGFPDPAPDSWRIAKPKTLSDALYGTSMRKGPATTAELIGGTS